MSDEGGGVGESEGPAVSAGAEARAGDEEKTNWSCAEGRVKSLQVNSVLRSTVRSQTTQGRSIYIALLGPRAEFLHFSMIHKWMIFPGYWSLPFPSHLLKLPRNANVQEADKILFGRQHLP